MRELRHNETRNKLEITKRAVMERTPDPGSILAEPVILHTRGCCLQLHFGPGPANDIPKVPGPLLLHLLHEGIRMRASDSDVQQTADHRAFALANGRLITQLTFPPLCIPFPIQGALRLLGKISGLQGTGWHYRVILCLPWWLRW